GNVDGTHLTFNPVVMGAPATLNAGEVADIGPTSTDFEVSGDHEFALETIMQGCTAVDPTSPGTMQRGGPSQSLGFAVEQYRTSSLFLAPGDYDVNDVVITGLASAKITLDGKPVAQTATPVGSGPYGVWRVPLSNSSESHTLMSDQPVGL